MKGSEMELAKEIDKFIKDSDLVKEGIEDGYVTNWYEIDIDRDLYDYKVLRDIHNYDTIYVLIEEECNSFLKLIKEYKPGLYKELKVYKKSKS